MRLRCALICLTSILLPVVLRADVAPPTHPRGSIHFARDGAAWHVAQRTRLHVLIMVNCDCQAIAALGSAIVRTWASAPAARRFATVKLVVGNTAEPDVKQCLPSTDERERVNRMILHLPQCPDGYPPVQKVLCMWEFARTALVAKYSHYMKVDADSYVNVMELIHLLNRVDPKEALFLGRAAKGRGQDNSQRTPYCMGFGYVATNALLAALRHNLSDVPRTAIPENSDRAIGMLIYNATGVHCNHNISYVFSFFYHRYFDFRHGALVMRTLNDRGQSLMPLYHGQTSLMLHAAVVHPLKTPTDMRQFHSMQLGRRLPLVACPLGIDDNKTQALRNKVMNLCVHSPTRQFEHCKVMPKECDAEPPIHPHTIESVSAHIIYLPDRNYSVAKATALRKVVEAHGIRTRMFAGVDMRARLRSEEETFGNALSAGERGCRTLWRHVLEHILDDDGGGGYEKLHMILEDDTMVAPNFGRQLDRLLRRNQRCGSFLAAPPGGVLLLGATVWGWKMYNAEVAKFQGDAKACYNVASATYGTFAVLMTARAARVAYKWIVSPAVQSHFNLPVDHMWKYLADEGLVVRALSPPLAYPTVDETTIERGSAHKNQSLRNRRHRWQFADG